jgi:hypothetical protein
MTRTRAYTSGTKGCGHADNGDRNYEEELLHRRYYTLRIGVCKPIPGAL